MSEQKNPNDINFDDEFLNIELDSVHTDVNSDTDSALNADFDELFNKTIPVSSEPSSKPDLGASDLSDDLILDGLTSDAFGINLTDTVAGHDITSGGIDLSKITDELSQHSPSEVSLPQTPNTADNTPHLDGADTAALLGATALAGIAGSSSSNDSDSSPNPESKPTKKAGLFGKKDATSKAPKPAKTKIPKSAGDKGDLTGLLDNPQKLNKMILGGVIALILVGVALYMAMSGNESPPPTNAAPTPVNTPAPDANAEVAPTPQTQTVSGAATPAGDDILPEIKPVVDPDEILNAEIPDDPALIKEEIDRLADKEAQIAEQEKLIQDQLTMMEDMTTAKAEHIALLEAQIAELEKQKGNNPAAPTTESK